MEGLTTTINSGNGYQAALAGLDYSVNALATAYNIYNNIKDKDYQKALQQQIFQREDTSVQRRAADLRAAGMNPNLAAGSAANAGGVVGRSVTPQINPGSALDTLAALNQVRQQQQETFNLKQQSTLNTIAINQKSAEADASMSEAKNWRNFQRYLNGESYEETPFIKQMKYQMSSEKNAAEILQKDNDWYTIDKISDMTFGAMRSFSPYMNQNKVYNKNKVHNRR